MFRPEQGFRSFRTPNPCPARDVAAVKIAGGKVASLMDRAAKGDDTSVRRCPLPRIESGLRGDAKHERTPSVARDPIIRPPVDGITHGRRTTIFEQKRSGLEPNQPAGRVPRRTVSRSTENDF